MAYSRRRNSGYSRGNSGFKRRAVSGRRKSGARGTRRASSANTMRIIVETVQPGPYSRHTPVLAKMNPPPGKAKF